MFFVSNLRFRCLFSAVFFTAICIISLTAFSQSETEKSEAKGEHHEKRAFDPGKIIFDHILDAHDWHLWGEHHQAVSIPLPVILYTDKGLDVFMSSAFHHGEASVHGKYDYKLAARSIKIVDAAGNVDEAATAKLKDFSITKNVVAIFISVALLLAMFLPVAKKYSTSKNQAPNGLQGALEPIILFVKENIVIPNIGLKHHEKYLPFLLTVFFFILTNNLLGLIPFFPGGANVTGNISIPFTLASLVLVLITITARKNYWMHILAMPGVPKPVLVILTPIEILSFFIRPFILMMRLFANIMAGHIVVLSFISLIFIFGEMNATAGYGVSVVSMFLVVAMSMLEILVAVLQAYVFTLLAALYLGSAIEEAHEEHH